MPELDRASAVGRRDDRPSHAQPVTWTRVPLPPLTPHSPPSQGLSKRQFLNFISLELLPASPTGWSPGTVSRTEVRQFQPLAPGSLEQRGQRVSRGKSPTAGTSGVAGAWPGPG